ncbi:MAG TPA: plastocyanin/azurin family copper-binding protein [Chryseosolibacter sp.]|nr:plastocyanin/azurin family copper-binding protein [Chryseosolibacter sp.]
MQRYFSGFFLLAILSVCCNEQGNEKKSVDGGYHEFEIAEPPASGDMVHVVEIIQMKFVPDVVNVSNGDTVVWINKDIVDHDVTERHRNLWRSSPMAGGSSFKLAVTKSQSYYCSLHVVMQGKIIVDGNEIATTGSPSEITMCQ